MNLLQRDVEQGGYARFVALKNKYPNLKTTIAVGGWDEGGKKYPQIASIPARRQTFVRSVVVMFFKQNFVSPYTNYIDVTIRVYVNTS